MRFISHRVSKDAQHNGPHKLSIHNLKIRVTRQPYGGRDKAANTKLPRILSVNSVLSQAKQPVELHRETAERVLTPPSIPKLFDHSNENQITYLTEGGGGTARHEQPQRASLANQRHQNPIKKKKKKQGQEIQLCTHPVPSVVAEGSSAGFCSRASRVEMGKAMAANMQPQLVGYEITGCGGAA